MAKYIIDIPDDTTCINALKYKDSKCVAARSYIFPDLIPYTEPDRKAVEDEVWEFASMLMNMHPDVAEDIYWSMNGGKGIGVAAEMTYQDAKARYDAWKAEKDKICVGDEVTEENGIWKGIVMNIDDTYDDLTIMDSSGQSCNGYKKKYFRKTGNHFDAIAELLKKMRGSDD